MHVQFSYVVKELFLWDMTAKYNDQLNIHRLEEAFISASEDCF